MGVELGRSVLAAEKMPTDHFLSSRNALYYNLNKYAHAQSNDEKLMYKKAALDALFIMGH